jgi:glutamyl-tRNA synthetase
VFPLEWTTAEGEIYSGYRENGYFPEAFINMLAFLGWNPGTTQEIFSLEALCKSFTLERVAKAGAKFDADKTKWFQQNYLRATAEEKLAEMLSSQLNVTLPSDKLIMMARLMKERATFISDMISEGGYLLTIPESYDEQTLNKKWKENTTELMTEWKDKLNTIASFVSSEIESTFKAFLEEKELGVGAVLPNFRLLITGNGTGPSMFEISEFLGKEECLKRMEIGLEKVTRLKTASL